MSQPLQTLGTRGTSERAPSSSLDMALVRKYASVAAPRYTSYPPATKFTDDLDTVRPEDAIREDNAREDNAAAATPDGASKNGGAARRPLSLYFHLPFCESRCWYCGCTTVITRNQEAADAYLDDLAREMELMARLIDGRRPVEQLHLGGGTPTFLTPEQLRRLNSLVRAHFAYAPDAEVSVEIDPRRFTREHVHALREMGAARASIGVQDTNRRVQVAVHRHQPHELNRQAVDWLREAGFASINIDLIYGLPLQTPALFARTLDDVLALAPDRVSAFSYAHVPWIKPAQRIFEDRGQLPGPDEKLAMFALAHERMTDAGYIDIGLDHFAKPGDELAVALREGTLHRNFQGYSTRAGLSLYAFGMSSISQTRDTYRQNTKDMVAYRSMLAGGRLPITRGLRLDGEDLRRREIIMRVMCARRLDYGEMSAALGVNFESAYARELDALRDLATDGIVNFTQRGVEVTPAGVPLLRIVAMRFDGTLGAGIPGAKQHARVI